MNLGGEHNFFFDKIALLLEQGKTPAEIYSAFHSQIAVAQAKKLRRLAVVFSLIDGIIRKLNVDTDDAAEAAAIAEKTDMLLGLERSVRSAEFDKDSEFLDAFETLMRFEAPDV